MMRATSDAAATVRTLVAAIADDRVRDLLIQLLLDSLTATTVETPPPTKRGRGWPPGKPRGPRKATKTNGAARTGAAATAKKALERKRESARRSAAKRRAAERARKSVPVTAASKPTKSTYPPHKAGDSNGSHPTVSAFWAHAKVLEPARPWLAVMKEFDVKELVARGCYDRQSLPPHVGPMAVTQFLALAPG